MIPAETQILLMKPPGKRRTMKMVERSLIWWSRNVSLSSSCLSVYSSLRLDGSSPDKIKKHLHNGPFNLIHHELS